ncbi:MAG: hypothetical protein A2X67_09295 [Ignavibacteria bacterium GWA2_55_11]|nr:MAG: hypothetical protein A2X67_09295 [Ignavibacteria bacterium GWA2_55_11]OGU46518.1 MAG: hypothetical protein A2X68_01125 [Ignavibacteria bacterium GWC2_56_12]OGU62337.1 MAG: hypothetical protein A3C56_04890 [Ignavibacteria bacterium RIFCSPHIGHO2_02_FULL_56_12]OGU75275.1 MAG: hypothetical protein A3H45_02570 [Ignavibacteria bacterium RIFCSPLOWO2_02_FULL_55_14]
MTDPRRTLSIISSVLLTGQFVFAAVSALVQRSVVPIEGMEGNTLLMIGIIGVLTGVGSSFAVGRFLVEGSMKFEQPEARVAAFVRAVIVRLAMLEAATIAALLCYLFSGEPIFLALAVIPVGSFMVQRPKEEEWDGLK